MSFTDKLMESLPAMLMDLDIDFAMKNFNKSKYLPFMDKFCEHNGEVLSEISEMISADDEWEKDFEEVADKVALTAKGMVKKKFFLTRSRYEIDLAYAMTCFIFPCIMTIDNEKAKKVCEIMASSWGKAFPSMNNIGVATKDEIHSGFKTKIFGIPIES